jgi:hypothetical protein
MLSQRARDAKSQQQRGENTISKSWTKPPEMLWDIQAVKWNTKAFQKAIFISVLAGAQRISIQKLSFKNKGALPCTLLQLGYRSKKQSLTHICCIHLYWLLRPQCYVTFLTFRFFKIYLPATLPASHLHYTVISALGKLRQETLEFKASLGSTVWAKMVSKNKSKKQPPLPQQQQKPPINHSLFCLILFPSHSFRITK